MDIYFLPMQDYLSRWPRKIHQANSTPGIMDSERNIMCQYTERWGKISRLTGQFHGMEAIG